MPRQTRQRQPSDVITIVRDTDVLDEIRVTWNENNDPVVTATYLVPDADGTIRREGRESLTNPTGFITSVFNSTT